MCESDFFEKKGIEQPEVIEPKVFCEETQWVENMGSNEQFDLIVSNMSMHWYNDIQLAMVNFHNSLVPDGAFISTSLGGDTLQELRICLNLAEQEREGGISPVCSPFLSVTELGNMFAKCQFNLPTIDSVH